MKNSKDSKNTYRIREKSFGDDPEENYKLRGYCLMKNGVSKQKKRN